MSAKINEDPIRNSCNVKFYEIPSSTTLMTETMDYTHPSLAVCLVSAAHCIF